MIGSAEAWGEKAESMTRCIVQVRLTLNWGSQQHTQQAGVDKQNLLIVNLVVDLCPIY